MSDVFNKLKLTKEFIEVAARAILYINIMRKVVLYINVISGGIRLVFYFVDIH